MHRVRTGQLFGLLLIPASVFGVDSTPWMGEWVGGWDMPHALVTPEEPSMA